MKKIIVVGGTASLATYLIPRLSRDHQVVTMGRGNCDLYCDLTDEAESFVVPEGTDVIIHVAASWGSNTDKGIINTEVVNSLGTLKVCMAAYKAKVKHFVLISSMSVAVDKDSLYYNHYAISKRHSEELAEFYCKVKSLPLTILRPSQIYDSKGYFRKHQPLFYLIADRAEVGRDIMLYGSKDALRNYIHVDDLTEIISCTVNKECLGEFSCTNPNNVKLTEIVHAAYKAFNKQGNIIFQKEKDDIQDNVFPNDTFLYDKIEFHPQININDGMKMLSNYRKEQIL
ncbi:nucleoside-diphosphate-sugar epimerase [Paenibacillus sp. DS2015]|uniref:NAD-dependent epimerase/dehydratase family protein n=1 Tax=Paenibacillus sp. DS2015 TaxID=3373917 RepID=UPI003D2104B6